MPDPTTRSLLGTATLTLVVLLVGCGRSDEAAPPPAAEPDSALVARGRELYAGSCRSCHGEHGEGVGLVKPLAGSKYVGDHSDAELVQMIIEGRPASHPLNTSGQLMPARGANPRLSDEDLLAIVAYLRTLPPPESTPGPATP